MNDSPPASPRTETSYRDDMEFFYANRSYILRVGNSRNGPGEADDISLRNAVKTGMACLNSGQRTYRTVGEYVTAAVTWAARRLIQNGYSLGGLSFDFFPKQDTAPSSPDLASAWDE
jgi:hypothetical protein